MGENHSDSYQKLFEAIKDLERVLCDFEKNLEDLVKLTEEALQQSKDAGKRQS